MTRANRQKGVDGLQSPKHPDIATCEGIHHLLTSPSRISHRVAKASTLRHPHLYRRQRLGALVSLYLHLSPANGKHVEAEDVWKSALHGSTTHGRNADLGHLRQLAHRSPHLPDPIHHCSTNDECPTTIKIGGVGRLHFQSSVRTTVPVKLVRHANNAHSVTAIGGAKIYLSYRDRLYSLFQPDWT